MKLKQRSIDRVALSLAGQFAEPTGVLDGILSLDDVQYVVDNTNPLENLVGERGLLGEALFPSQNRESLDFAYLKGAGGGVVIAQVTSHNSEAPLIGRKGVQRVAGQIPAIKQKRHKDAETLIRLQSREDAIRQGAIDEVFDDVSAVRNGAAGRLEKIRMDALATGVAANADEEGLVYSVDYQVPAGHKATLAGTDLWSDKDNSDPLADIEGWQNTLVADQGVPGARIVSSSAVQNAFRSHPLVREAAFGVNKERRLTMAEANAFLAEQGLPQFLPPYDVIVQQEGLDGTRSATRLYPNDRLTIIPDAGFGQLGTTHRAPTAEEGLRQVAEGIITIDGQRMAVHIYVATNDPKGVVTLGVASAFPSFEAADYVFMAKVL